MLSLLFGVMCGILVGLLIASEVRYLDIPIVDRELAFLGAVVSCAVLGVVSTVSLDYVWQRATGNHDSAIRFRLRVLLVILLLAVSIFMAQLCNVRVSERLSLIFCNGVM